MSQRWKNLTSIGNVRKAFWNNCKSSMTPLGRSIASYNAEKKPPKMDETLNFYEQLIVPQDAPVEFIMKRFRKLSLLYHPDHGRNQAGLSVDSWPTAFLQTKTSGKHVIVRDVKQQMMFSPSKTIKTLELFFVWAAAEGLTS